MRREVSLPWELMQLHHPLLVLTIQVVLVPDIATRIAPSARRPRMVLSSDSLTTHKTRLIGHPDTNTITAQSAMVPRVPRCRPRCLQEVLGQSPPVIISHLQRLLEEKKVWVVAMVRCLQSTCVLILHYPPHPCTHNTRNNITLTTSNSSAMTRIDMVDCIPWEEAPFQKICHSRFPHYPLVALSTHPTLPLLLPLTLNQSHHTTKHLPALPVRPPCHPLQRQHQSSCHRSRVLLHQDLRPPQRQEILML